MANSHTYPDRRIAEADLDVRDLKVGADVRCEHDWPAAGTWARYAGRVGRVVTINVQTFPPPLGGVYVELGVAFTNHGTSADAWFVPAELERSYGAFKAPRSRATPAGGQMSAPDPFNALGIAHSNRFRRVSNRYPHQVAVAYDHDIARAAGDSDEQVAVTVAAWEAAQGVEPRDWHAIAAEERDDDDWDDE